VGVADRNSKSVRSVLRRGQGQTKQSADHALDLIFISLSVTDHCAFYLQGGIFKDRQAGNDSSQKCHASGMPQFKGRHGIFCQENLLDGHRLRFELNDNFRQPLMNDFKAKSEIAAGLGADGSVTDMAKTISRRINNAVTSDTGAGVDS